MTIRDYSFKTKSGLSFEVTATSKSESRAKITSRNDLFAFCHGFCTPEWWISLPGAMVQHDGPNRAFMAPGSEIHHSGVQNPWQRANRSFLDVILALDSDSEVAVTSKLSPDQVMGPNVK